MNDTHNSLQLECGDPQSSPATFSRFVFPFAYVPMKWPEESIPRRKSEKNPLVYIEMSDSDTSEHSDLLMQVRRDYFTHETQTVVFDSAKWLQMDPDRWRQTTWGEPIPLKSRGRTIPVSMLPPQLLLFEWSADAEEENGVDPTKIFQTGFLLCDLYFPDYVEQGCHKPELDDLLLINDLFRYYLCPYPGHGKKYRPCLQEVPLTYQQEAGKDEKRKVGDADEDDKAAYLLRWTRLLDYRARIDQQDWRLVPEDFCEQTCNSSNHPCQDGAIPYADQRTYVWSAAILKGGAKALGRRLRTSQWCAHQFGHWIRLLNVDPPDDSGVPSKTHNNVSQFERDWAWERTYHRWEEEGTWYGFSYHSGVLLGPPSEMPPMWCHFRLMYFDMVILLLYVRISLFRFSRCLTEITTAAEITAPSSLKKFENLRAAFSTFTIRYQFPLLSNQQQGIELYTLARKHFDIDDLYKEVKMEIDSTHDFMETLRQARLNKSANVLARLGIPLATGALVASIFGMNAKDFPLLDWGLILFSPQWWKDYGFRRPGISLLAMSLIVLAAVVCGYAYVKCKTSKVDE